MDYFVDSWTSDKKEFQDVSVRGINVVGRVKKEYTHTENKMWVLKGGVHYGLGLEVFMCFGEYSQDR